MDETSHAQIDRYVTHLQGLIRVGEKLRDTLATQPSDPSVVSATRAWQEACGVTVNELSGGSKAHWLARSFSSAFLMRSEEGRAIEEAGADSIVGRLLDVLKQAVVSLTQQDVAPIISSSVATPEPHRFDFVHNLELRPVLEQAYIESRRALEHGLYEEAMRTSGGILEAIVTDALEHKGLTALHASGAPVEKIENWSFETRLTIAEKAGLIRGGCARLPAIARTYRDSSNSQSPPISDRDARQTAQVLRVIMRDLDPGR